MSLEINFDKVNTDQEWVDALVSIFNAAPSANLQERSKLIILITTFVQRSPSRVSTLDDIALGLQSDLGIADINARIAAIKARNTVLKQHVEDLGLEVKTAKRDAGSLTRIKAEIDKAAETINAMKTIAAQFETPNISVNAKIQAVVTALESLSRTVNENNG